MGKIDTTREGDINNKDRGKETVGDKNGWERVSICHRYGHCVQPHDICCRHVPALVEVGC